MGTGNTGVFTKAQFTVNNVERTEVTYKKPTDPNYFCDLYTIPANTYDFGITAKVFNSIL